MIHWFRRLPDLSFTLPGTEVRDAKVFHVNPDGTGVVRVYPIAWAPEATYLDLAWLFAAHTVEYPEPGPASRWIEQALRVHTGFDTLPHGSTLLVVKGPMGIMLVRRPGIFGVAEIPQDRRLLRRRLRTLLSLSRSERMKARFADPEFREQALARLTKAKQSERWRKRMSEGRKGSQRVKQAAWEAARKRGCMTPWQRYCAETLKTRGMPTPDARKTGLETPDIYDHATALGLDPERVCEWLEASAGWHGFAKRVVEYFRYRRSITQS